MQSIQIDKLVAWLATLLCTALAARSAQVFGSRESRIFAVFSLFAVYWAVLLVYYSSPYPLELLPALNGFLLVYVGGVLRRHASTLTQMDSLRDSPQDEVGALDRWAIWLFLLLVIPVVIGLGSELIMPAIDRLPAVETSLGTAMTLLGFASLLYGLRNFFGRRAWALCLIILIIYSALEIAYSVKFWQSPAEATLNPSIYTWWRTPSTPPMTDEFRYAFAAMKCLLTTVFVYVVVRATDPSSTNNKRMMFERFLGVAR